MNAKREQMVDRLIRIYGYENSNVIQFCRLCEEKPDTEDWDDMLEIMVGYYEKREGRK